jgi:hypothetical protein
MVNQISKETREELVGAIRDRYKDSTKKQKARILDELSALTGFHRKHSIRLVGAQGNISHAKEGYGHAIYNQAVREALVVLWEASDRICGKRLKALLPNLVDAMERHGHVQLDPEVRQLLLQASAATVDRLLKPIRKVAKPGRPHRRPKKASSHISIRTFSDWNNPPPGYLEIDFVEHNGGLMEGSCAHSLVSVDICSGWVEAIPLLAKSQDLVIEALEAMSQNLPFQILGIDSDNDSAFINDTLISYCQGKGAEFTRSRPYRKNDQAWIEQKNGAVIRRFVGYARYSDIIAGQVLSNLYQAVRLYVNFFQPSFKQLEKEKLGSKVKRFYGKPMTPFERLSIHPAITSEVKEKLESLRRTLDPLALLRNIRKQQEALAALVSRENNIRGTSGDDLEQFIKQLGELWRQGEVRATHRTSPQKAHWWRTRKDPFEEIWPTVLLWIHERPNATAKELFERLQNEQPGRFLSGQLRTLQRKVRTWRHVIAKGLVFRGQGTPFSSLEVPLTALDSGEDFR